MKQADRFRGQNRQYLIGVINGLTLDNERLNATNAALHDANREAIKRLVGEDLLRIRIGELESKECKCGDD